jgi:hypothetical protein
MFSSSFSQLFNDLLAVFYIISVTTDNASVNDVIVSVAGQIVLAKYGVSYTPDMHIRCIAHVVNLVVQAVLAALDEADDPDNIDYFTLHKETPIHYSVDKDEDQARLEAEELGECDIGDEEEADVFDAAEKDTLENMENSSPLKRVSTPLFISFYSTPLIKPLAAFHNEQDCLFPSTSCQIPKDYARKIWQQP